MSDPHARRPERPVPPSALTLTGVDAGYGDRAVLHGVDVSAPLGGITGILGPNGCGKSTTLRVANRLLSPTAGSVHIGDQRVTDLSRRDLARKIAMLPQNPVAPEGMTVLDLASRGRQPHQPWYRQWSEHDESVVRQAMIDTAVLDLAERPLDELSGGQRQRAWLAMVLAQQSEVVLLDEPIAHLDPAHAVEVLELLVRLRSESGRTFVVVLHDLVLATRFTDHLIIMKQGRVVTTGTAEEIIHPDLLESVFGLDALVFPDPAHGRPVVVPAGHA